MNNKKEHSQIPRLYHWYISKETCMDGKTFAVAHGNVTGHKKLPDTMFIHTSKIVEVCVDQETEQVVIQTRNTEYHCRLSDIDYSKPDTSDYIPELSEYAKKYGKEREYTLDDNTILLVLSDHEEYYFEKMIIKKDGKVYDGEMYTHIGTFQDSCLISCYGFENGVDIRYFPHAQHLETYCQETDSLPIYLQNSGDRAIYFTANEGVIMLEPGMRKLVSKENTRAVSEIPDLDRNDLYPAVELSPAIRTEE